MELPSPNYLGSGALDHFGYSGNDPSLSGHNLQEMIDADMKTEFDDVLIDNTLNFQVSHRISLETFLLS